MRTVIFVVSAAVMGSALEHPASAEQCGTNPNSWNVPPGGAMFLSSDGPIRAVIQAIGEKRSHVILSNGPQLATQTSMVTPGQRSTGEDGFCSAPVDIERLRHGYPGAESIHVSAVQSYARGADFTAFQGASYDDLAPPDQGDVGTAVELRSSYPNTAEANGIVRERVNGTSTPYYLNQYMDSGGASWSLPTVENGLVCSTLLARVQSDWARHLSDYLAWQATGDYGSDLATKVAKRFIAPFVYSHEQTMSAGYQLYDSVKGDCENGVGFWNTLGAGLICAFDFDLCDEAAAQVRNCMAFGDCANGDPGHFDDQAGNPSFVASSISPDYLGGWTAGQNFRGPNQSVWAWDTDHMVQFSGENEYDCWFN
jgi:hypothetical protein